LTKNSHNPLFAACPDHCSACELDSSTSSIVCTDGSCDVDYGNIADGTCGGEHYLTFISYDAAYLIFTDL